MFGRCFGDQGDLRLPVFLILRNIAEDDHAAGVLSAFALCVLRQDAHGHCGRFLVQAGEDVQRFFPVHLQLDFSEGIPENRKENGESKDCRSGHIQERGIEGKQHMQQAVQPLDAFCEEIKLSVQDEHPQRVVNGQQKRPEN